MRSLDTIETLETFVVLARLGSVGKTAEQLHISKASVSRRISALEKSVGKLFVRDQDGSELLRMAAYFLKNPASLRAFLISCQRPSHDRKAASAEASEYLLPTRSEMVC